MNKIDLFIYFVYFYELRNVNKRVITIFICLVKLKLK